MTTISFTYNERNVIARKTIDYILSLGIFSDVQTTSASKKRTLKAIEDVRAGKDVTRCATFEDYLRAIEQ